jgi:hypothetical protein
MSEAVRNYTGHAGSLRSQPRGRRRGFFIRVLLPFTVLLGIVLWWTTRDTYQFNECIPKGQRITMIMDDPLPARQRVAQSRVWQAIPDTWTAIKRPDVLSADLGLPQWVLNNVFYKRAILTGNDLGPDSDVVVLTRMTRIGALLERFHGFASAVDDDYAGGLHLRAIPEDGLYYAVRGRILLFSVSRPALIRALTLSEDDRLEQATFDELARAGGEDIRGTIALDQEQPLGQYFESVAFAIRIDGETAHAKCRGVLRPDTVARFSALMDGVQPVPLRVPPAGLISLSADFGKPISEVWAALGTATGVRWLSEAQWAAWEGGVPDQPPGAAQMITGLVGDKGPGIRLAIADVDVNELLPLPILVGTADADASAVKRQLESIPSPPDEANPWDAYPRYNPETGVASIPMIGGPSLEPAASVHQNTFVFSSSRTAVDKILAENLSNQNLTEPGNLYMQIRPAPVVASLVKSGRLFVEIDSLRGFTKDSFEAAAEAWIASAEIVDEITVLAGVSGDAIEFELRVSCASTNTEGG